MPDIRVISVNMHMGVPEGLRLGAHNERVQAVDDLACFLRDVDADVVFMQEVRNDSPESRGGMGVPRQYERLRQAVRATGSSYGVTVASGAGDEYGICTFTRRGVRLERTQVARLPFADDREVRVLLFGQAVVDDYRFTVANLHLDHTGMDRGAQLSELERVLETLLAHGTATITTPDGNSQSVAGYEGPLVVGGDFNDAEETVAAAMTRTALVNVIDGLHDHDPLRGDTHVRVGRIDHLLLSPDIRLLSQDLHIVPMRTLTEGSGVTDHLAVAAHLRLPD